MGNVCPECKGSGEYRGLNTVEPCRACGGFKSMGDFARAVMGAGLVDSRLRENKDAPGIKEFLDDVRTHTIQDVCQQFAIPPEVSGQSIRHEIEEQITEDEIPQLSFTLSDQSSLSVSCSYDRGTVETNHGPMRVRPDETWTIITLLNVPHKKEYYERYQLYHRLIKNRESFTATITDQFGGTVTKTVVLKSVSPDGVFCDIELEAREIHA
jgi:hypothetical protein